MLIRQRPGSAKGVVSITIEDGPASPTSSSGPTCSPGQRKIVMGARLMAVYGIVQREPDSDVIHVVARQLEDRRDMLGQLSDGGHAFDPVAGRSAPDRWRAPAAPAVRERPRTFPKAAIPVSGRVR